VTSGDDPVGIRNDGAVIQKHVDVVLGGQKRADVPVQDEVRQLGALDRLGDFRIRGMNQCADLATDVVLPARLGVDVSVDARIRLERHSGRER
jgi:hypothetical protein